MSHQEGNAHLFFASLIAVLEKKFIIKFLKFMNNQQNIDWIRSLNPVSAELLGLLAWLLKL